MDHIGLDMPMKTPLPTKLDMLTSSTLLVSWFGLSILIISGDNGIKKNFHFCILFKTRLTVEKPWTHLILNALELHLCVMYLYQQPLPLLLQLLVLLILPNVQKSMMLFLILEIVIGT